MAYANLVGQAVSTMGEAFQRMRDFICKRSGTYDYSTSGIGWTLHDAVYAVNENTLTAGDYFIVYSPGENGLEDMYFKFTYTSATIISFAGYLYWDNVAHTGTQTYTGANVFSGTPTVLYVYGSKNNIMIWQTISSTQTFGFIGKYDISYYDETITTCATNISSGSNVVIPVASVPPSWSVGKYIFIRDRTNIQRTQITVIDGNNVTVNTLATGFTASQGIKISRRVTYFISTTNPLSNGFPSLINAAGAKATANLLHTTLIAPTFTNKDSMDTTSIGAIPFMAFYEGEFSNFLLPTRTTSLLVYVLNGVNYRNFLLAGTSTHFLCREV